MTFITVADDNDGAVAVDNGDKLRIITYFHQWNDVVMLFVIACDFILTDKRNATTKIKVVLFKQ